MGDARQCVECSEVKGISDFYIHSKNSKALRRTCKPCFREAARRRKAAKRKPRTSLIGERFGDLVALDLAPPSVVEALGFPRKRGARYLCACACGQATYVLGYQLKSGNTKSCGCGQYSAGKENIKKAQESIRIPDRRTAALRRVLSIYYRNAASRKIEWSISEDSVRALIFANCSYCGAEPTNAVDLKHRAHIKTADDGEPVRYNGIDRVDSSKGYEEGNVVTCCKTCNTAKMNLTLSEFQNWIRRVYERLPG